MILHERHTNLKSATAEAHKHAKGKRKTHYVYGARGNYRVSDKQPEGDRHISVTPGGNEWSCSCDKDGAWTRSRLGMVSMGEGKLRALAKELDETIQSFDEVIDLEFEWLTEEFYQDHDLAHWDKDEIDVVIGAIVDGIDEGLSEDELIELAISEGFLGRAAKAVVRGGFKAHGKAKKIRKQMKQAGGAKKWAKARIKSKAKQMVRGAKKKIRRKAQKAVGAVHRWAHN